VRADHILEPTFNVKGGIDEVIPSDLLAGSETSRLSDEVIHAITTNASASAILGSAPGVAPDVLARVTRSRLRADGPLPRGEDPAGREWRALRDIARGGGILEVALNRSLLQLSGGREHDVIADGVYCYKVTKVGCAGYWLSLEVGKPMLIPARPLQYLDRFALHNRVFADAVEVVAVAVAGEWRQSLVIRQRFVHGAPPTMDDLDSWLKKLEFVELDVPDLVGHGGKTYANDAVCLSDVRSPNAVYVRGDIVPIDFLVRRVRPDLVSRLQLRP
jgi:hypothetical protein